MPQMSALFWLVLMISFIVVFILLMSLIYYSFLYVPQSRATNFMADWFKFKF